jgi:3-mercaptopyruvate sulfurtransferase SseA
MNRNIKAIGAFFFFALTIIGASCASSTQASKMQTVAATAPSALETAPTPPQPDDGVPRISAAEAIEMFKSGKALIIDTRDAGSFEQMHVKGASNVPYKDFLDKTYKAFPKNKELIFYCT